MTNDRVDLVLKGGGVKGIAMAGTLAAIEDAGLRSVHVAGASAGAIVGALHAAGFSAVELRDKLADVPFRDFLDRGWEDYIPLIGRGMSVLLDQGIYEGDAFQEWLEGLLAEKNVRTFADLPVTEPDATRFAHRLQVIVSDVTENSLLVLPRDAQQLGVDPNELNVAFAVRMSMSIPLFFEPVLFKNPRTGRTHVLVDGGMLSNFPVWLFDATSVPRWPTLGLMLVDGAPEEPILERMPSIDLNSGPIRRTSSYIRNLISTMMEAHDRLHLADADFVRTIPIPNLGVATTQFDLTMERALELYESGRSAGTKFFGTWNFEEYVAQYRSDGEPVSRTERLAAELSSTRT